VVTRQLSLFDPPFEHLTIDLTPAMRRGEQAVWQCSWCGCIVVTDRGRPADGACPACTGSPTAPVDAAWWRQRLPVAGIREAHPLDRDQLLAWLAESAQFYDQMAQACEDHAPDGPNGSAGFRADASACRFLASRLRALDLDEWRPR
jgi:hypothetical protein